MGFTDTEGCFQVTIRESQKIKVSGKHLLLFR